MMMEDLKVTEINETCCLNNNLLKIHKIKFTLTVLVSVCFYGQQRDNFSREYSIVLRIIILNIKERSGSGSSVGIATG
jgi:hypothetical protein